MTWTLAAHTGTVPSEEEVPRAPRWALSPPQPRKLSLALGLNIAQPGELEV